MIPIKNLAKKEIRSYIINQNIRKTDKIFREKILHLKNTNRFKPFPDEQIRPVVYDYPIFKNKYKIYLDFYYSVLEKSDKNFLPNPIYYNHIEPMLNNIKLLHAFKDKNFYDMFLKDVNTPLTILRKINEGFYDSDYKSIELSSSLLSSLTKNKKDLMLKPSIDSGGGLSIQLFKLDQGQFFSEGKKITVEMLTSFPDFVLQEVITQHQFYQKFNPGSNNTIRVFTYRSVIDEEVHILHRLLRIGKKGAFTDHDNLGGIVIGINEQHQLNPYGLDINGTKFFNFNAVDLSQKNEAPFLCQVEEIASSIARKVFYGRILAFDFSIDLNGEVILLEINGWRNGISQYQMNNGALFGQFTDEIMSYCNGKDFSHILTI
ncbi:MAG: hypothetical protein FJY07_01170 [Bacteroidetes bacterium]|nr:hypothetical protein [Bacteroidota bacterium]